MERMFTVWANCSWCGERNETTDAPVYCDNCGHRADVSRIRCDCPVCLLEKDDGPLVTFFEGTRLVETPDPFEED